VGTAEFYQQYKKIEKNGGFNQKLARNPIYQVHPSAIYTSRLIDTTSIKSFLKSQNLQVIDGKIYSGLLSVDSFKPLYSRNNVAENSNELNIFSRNSSLGDLTGNTKRQLSLETQNKTFQEETKSLKLDEIMSEPAEINNYN
jgi:hypothetical protein